MKTRLEETLEKRGPLTKAELQKALGDTTAKQLSNALEEMQSEGVVYCHPPRTAGPLYGLKPADPLDYLRPDLRSLVRKIEKKGFGQDEVCDALSRFVRELTEFTKPPGHG